MNDEIIAVGTRIRFTQTLDMPANEEHPHLIYAIKGETGEVTGHGSHEGYWVKTDRRSDSFGASHEEFTAEGVGKQ